MDFIGELGDPTKVAAAIRPIVDAAVAEAISGIAQQVAPAIGAAVQSALDGITISITISRKAQ
jgi:hypothetical protein